MRNKSSLVLIIFIFILFNFIFNFSNWGEIFSKTNFKKSNLGDSSMAEFILENNYQKIIRGKNPFILEKQLFHPFSSINISLNDPSISNVVFSLLLRPLLDPHKTLIALILINIFLNNLFMYLLLKKLKITNLINIIISLTFGYLPIINYKFMGHFSYTSIYIFPLVFLIILKILEVKDKIKKTVLAIIFGLLMSFILLLNFYYFIVISLVFAFYLFYFSFLNRKLTKNFFINNFQYILAAFTVFLITLIPWLLSVYSLIKSGGVEKTKGLGAIELSGDLMGFFVPSEYNPIYKFIFSRLADFNLLFARFMNFYLHNNGKYNYAGLIVIFSYLLLIFIRKKIPNELWKKIKPHFLISLLFALLTLGPFLKIFNRWFINLDGVSVVFPTPFILLRYIPGLSSIRAPTRFTPPFIFLALIVSAFLLDYILKKLKGTKLIIFITFLFFIFLVDLYFIFPKKITTYFPLQIYKKIEKEHNLNTVLEIPFTVRDGFRYMGYVHAISPMNGQLIHKKPIIGGYIARVPESIFNYYKNLKFISYIAKIIDKGNFNLLKEKPKEIKLYPYPYSDSSIIQEMNILKIKYVILKNDEKYSDYLLSLFKRIGYNEILTDRNYLLLEQ